MNTEHIIIRASKSYVILTDTSDDVLQVIVIFKDGKQYSVTDAQC